MSTSLSAGTGQRFYSPPQTTHKQCVRVLCGAVLHPGPSSPRCGRWRLMSQAERVFRTGRNEAELVRGNTEDPLRAEGKKTKWAMLQLGSCLWTSWEGCWYSPEGLWGIFKLQGWGSLIAAVFLDHFWKEYKNVVSKSGQEANGYRRGETVSFSRTLTTSPG